MKNQSPQKENQNIQEGSANFAKILVAVIGIAMLLLIAKVAGIF